MNTASITYKNVLGLARQLDPLEQLRLLEELAVSLRHDMTSRSHRSILELRGMGKEIWRGVDAQTYVRQERATWRG